MTWPKGSRHDTTSQAPVHIFLFFLFFYTINVFCVRLWMEEQNQKGKEVGRGSRCVASQTPNMFFFSNSIYQNQYHGKWPAPQNHKQVPPALWTTPTGAQDETCLKPQLLGRVFFYLHIIYISIDISRLYLRLPPHSITPATMMATPTWANPGPECTQKGPKREFVAVGFFSFFLSLN